MQSPTSNASPQPMWAVVARVLRPQGRHGEVLAEILTSFPEKFAERERLYLLLRGADSPDARELQVADHWFPTGKSAGCVVLKFSGVDSIEQAEQLGRMELAVPATERAATEDGEYYIADLVGASVEADGESLGTVEDVDMAGTGTPLLIVKEKDGQELLLPLAKAFLEDVDIAAKRIRMRLPEGLLDINRPPAKPSAQE